MSKEARFIPHLHSNEKLVDFVDIDWEKEQLNLEQWNIPSSPPHLGNFCQMKRT